MRDETVEREAAETIDKIVAPVLAALDRLERAVDGVTASVADHGAKIVHLAARVRQIEAASLAQLLDPAPAECPHCGEEIQPEPRMMQ